MNDTIRNCLLAFILVTLFSCCLCLDRIAWNVNSLYGHACK